MKLALSEIFNMKYDAKEQIAEGSLLALGVVFENLSKTCDELKAEIADWDEGRSFAMGILHDGPAVTLKKENGQIKYLGKGLKDPDLTIYFKNIDSALLVFLGIMGAHTAAVQRRTIIHGNLVEAVQTVRAMAIVQKYLFPDFIVRKTFKRIPKMNMREKMLKAQTYTVLAPLLITSANR